LSDPTKKTTFRTVEFSDSAFEWEGLRFSTVKSSALGRRADCCIWAPRLSPSEDIETLLILLHGVYGSAWSWALKTGVHCTAQRMIERGEIRPLAIAMPSDSLQGDGSGYLKYPGLDVERWIVEEVPAVARLAIPALRRGARVAIAGLSMGGYGALRLGARYAGHFHAISAHSAITRIEEMTSFVEEPIEMFTADASPEELNVLHLLLKNREKLPPIRFDCGIADSLIQGNRTLHHALVAAKIPHLYEEYAGGHEWSYWAEHIAATLRFVASPHSPG
jgi:putative tributyrin esterase